jgi:hypothetical protein
MHRGRLGSRTVWVAALGRAQDGLRQTHQRFPLWIEVPGSRFAVLNEGQLGNGTQWGAYISRLGKRSAGFERPCITVSRVTRIGEFNSATDCGVLISEAKPDLPVYASISLTYRTAPSSPVRAETVMGLTFDPVVAKVILKSADGGQITTRPLLMSKRQQKKSHLPPLRFVALAMQRSVCIKNVVGFDGRGAEIFTAPTGVCP